MLAQKTAFRVDSYGTLHLRCHPTLPNPQTIAHNVALNGVTATVFDRSYQLTITRDAGSERKKRDAGERQCHENSKPIQHAKSPC